jgi:hypothetical protein
MLRMQRRVRPIYNPIINKPRPSIFTATTFYPYWSMNRNAKQHKQRMILSDLKTIQTKMDNIDYHVVNARRQLNAEHTILSQNHHETRTAIESNAQSILISITVVGFAGYLYVLLFGH